MKKSLIVVALASAVFGEVVAEAKPAAAWWVHQYGGTLASYQYGERVYGGAVEHPIVSSSSTPMTDAVSISIEVYNLRSDSITTAQICAGHQAGYGQTCSATQTQSGLGYKHFDFSSDEAVWNKSVYFPYAAVYALNNANVVANNARVNGIVISN